jgi:hypothetical protein
MLIEQAKANTEAVVIAFGESFVDNGSDHTFGFSPERGVHDIHMMQGNSGSFSGRRRRFHPIPRWRDRGAVHPFFRAVHGYGRLGPGRPLTGRIEAAVTVRPNVRGAR